MKHRLFLFSLLLAGTAFLFSCQSKTTDADVQQNINDLFTKDMAGAALNAVVDSGVATITGQCNGAGCTAEVAEKVKKVKGVKEVVTHIVEKQ